MEIRKNVCLILLYRIIKLYIFKVGTDKNHLNHLNTTWKNHSIFNNMYADSKINKGSNKKCFVDYKE